MSHELRTPLNAIIGFSDLLIEGTYGVLNNEQIEFVEDIKNSAEHQFEMISHILDISKIESGHITLKIEKFNLKDLVEGVSSTIKPLFNKKSIIFEIKGLEKKIFVEGDTLKLRQIIYNLLSNAIKFTEKGKITIEYYDNFYTWGIKVSDTGIGIKEEDYHLIFKDFKRVKSEYVNSKPGSGLGLALTKRLVELHHGQITFKSKVGKGTTFDFNIPKKMDPIVKPPDISTFLNLL
jgi:signal transduction histidine kinase